MSLEAAEEGLRGATVFVPASTWSLGHMDGDQTPGTSLPRGLVTRSGLPVKPGQRIPSLRTTESLNSSMSHSTSNSSTNNNAINGNRVITPGASSKTTRGGATRRIFKPTIPPKDAPKEPQASTSSNKKMNDKAHSSDSKRGTRNSSRGGHSNNRQNSKDKNKFIQTESSVFTGATGEIIRKEKKLNGSVDRSKATVLINKTAQDGQSVAPPRRRLDSLLQDKFIASSDDEDDDDAKSRSEYFGVKPLGWDNLIHPTDEANNCKKTRDNDDGDGRTCDLVGDLIQTRAKEGTCGRLILMQLSNELLSESSDRVLECISNDIESNGQLNNPSQLGMIGRMRVHKSGKVTFVSTSGSVSEVNLTDEMKPLYVKTEDGNRMALVGIRGQSNSNTQYSLNQYAVHFDPINEQVVSLGTIETNEKLLVLPDITTHDDT